MEVYNVTISRCPDSKIKIPIKHLNISWFYLILEGKWQLLEKWESSNIEQNRYEKFSTTYFDDDFC